MDMRFHEFYRKFSTASRDTNAEPPPFDEFASLCREAELAAAAPDVWLGDADDCLHAIAESSSLFAPAISKWLTQVDFMALAKALAHKANVQHLGRASPVAYDLAAIPQTQSILVGYRLCALAATPAISLGWTLSLAQLPSQTPAVAAAVKQLLTHLVEEQPSSALRLLSSKDSPFSTLDIANEALRYLQAEADWLKEQPSLREFAMTTEMRLAFRSLRRGENREIQRRSQGASFFANLFKAQHFKYANRTAIEFAVGNQVQETTVEMAPYGLSVELPLSERVDPVLGAQVRSRLWQGPQ